MKDDPSKPYKMIAAIVSAFLTSFLATNATDMPPWAVGLVTALVAAIAVFMTPNPKVADAKVDPPTVV
jgi:hypothetical protein